MCMYLLLDFWPKGLIDIGAKSNHYALSFIRRAHLAVQTKEGRESYGRKKVQLLQLKAFSQLKFNSVVVLMMRLRSL